VQLTKYFESFTEILTSTEALICPEIVIPLITVLSTIALSVCLILSTDPLTLQRTSFSLVHFLYFLYLLELPETVKEPLTLIPFPALMARVPLTDKPPFL